MRDTLTANKIWQLLKQLEKENENPELGSRSNMSRGIRDELRKLGHSGGLLNGTWREFLKHDSSSEQPLPRGPRKRSERMEHDLSELNPTRLTLRQLLVLHSRVAGELRERKITRTSNNLTGELAEYLFCKAFKWEQSGNSQANFDALEISSGLRYQIKGRRITANKSRQLSALRDMAGGHFDYIAGVLFNEDYTVLRAALIPHAVALEHSTYGQHTNSHRFILREDIWNVASVRDVTKELRKVKL